MSVHPLPVVVAVLALTSPFAMAQSGRNWDKSYPVNGRPSLDVSVGEGSLRTTSCGNCRAVTIHIDLKSQDLKNYTLEESVEGNHIHFLLKKREGRQGYGWEHFQSPEITVQTPAESDVDLRTGSGGLELSGVRGNLSVRSGSGGIRVQEAAGSLRAEAGSGGITANGGFAEFRMRSGSGTVTLTSARQIASDSSISSGSGGVHLSVPRDFRASVHAATGSGDIHSDLPLSASGDWGRGRAVDGTLNGGGPALELRTGSGGVHISGI